MELLKKKRKKLAPPTTVVAAVNRVMNSGAWMTTDTIAGLASELLNRQVKKESVWTAMHSLRSQGRTILRRGRVNGFAYEFRLVRKGGK